MTSILFPDAGPPTVSGILDAGFRLYRLTVWPNLVLSVALVAAAQAPNIYRLNHAGRDPAWWLLFAGGTLCSLTLWAALVQRQWAMAQGQSRPLGLPLLRAAARLIARVARRGAWRRGRQLLRGRLGLSAAVFALTVAVFLVFHIVFAVLGVMLQQALGGDAAQLRGGASYAGYAAQVLFAPLLTAVALSGYAALSRSLLPGAQPDTPAAADRSAGPGPPR